MVWDASTGVVRASCWHTKVDEDGPTHRLPENLVVRERSRAPLASPQSPALRHTL